MGNLLPHEGARSRPRAPGVGRDPSGQRRPTQGSGMQLVGRDGTVPRRPRGRRPVPWLLKPVENRPVPIVIAVAVGVFGVHAVVASGGGYLNYVSGIWLALANDLQHGVF